MPFLALLLFLIRLVLVMPHHQVDVTVNVLGWRS